MAAARVILNEAAIHALLTGSDNAPIARALIRAGEVVMKGAKRRCPTSPAGSVDADGNRHPSGTLRSSIRANLDGSGSKMRAVIGTDIPYALYVEFGTRAHIIESTGPWPLRNRMTGQTFGRVVHHPGTPAQPYLRPALDDLHGVQL